MKRQSAPAASIVGAARERHSDLIYISTDHAPSEEKLLGPTTRYVLAKRPCRVIVESAAGNGHVPAALKGAHNNGVGTPIPVG